MSNKQIELKIQKQIEHVNTIISGLLEDGHEIDISTLDLLDELAIYGLELTPIKDVNIPSLAYFHLIKEGLKKDKANA